MEKILLCKDANGKNIYPGDTVELFIGMEMKSSWKSKVFWNPLDGAFVNAHPGHVKMKLAKHRDLRSFIDVNPVTVKDIEGKDVLLECWCKKVK